MGKITFMRQMVDSDGVVTEQIMETKIANEPDFVKLYLDDIAVLSELPKWVSPVLHELLRYTNYENKIILNSSLKKQIAEKLEMAYKSIDNCLVKLTKSEILIRLDKGIYLANPYIFGRGKWENIRAIRLTLNYKSGKKVIASSDVDKN